jgi:hypothetical protein
LARLESDIAYPMAWTPSLASAPRPPPHGSSNNQKLTIDEFDMRASRWGMNSSRLSHPRNWPAVALVLRLKALVATTVMQHGYQRQLNCCRGDLTGCVGAVRSGECGRARTIKLRGQNNFDQYNQYRISMRAYLNSVETTG